MKKIILITYVLSLVNYIFSFHLQAQCNTQQPPLTFVNPSFEGAPQAHVTPAPWNTCGLTPDTQPGSWGVTLPPSDGNSYIGLVNSAGWVEGASQQMSGNLIAGVTYTFTVDLAVVANPTPGSGIVAGPSRLTIFGANAICAMTELLWTSPNVNNTNWVTYTVTFTPSQNYSHIYFRVDNTTHNGSYILVDNITPIVPQLPTIDITSHVNGNNTACAFTLSGTLSLPLADSILVTGPFNGSPLHANVNGTNWNVNLQFNTPGTYTVYARVFYYDATTNSHACSYDSVIVNVSAPTAAFTAQNHCLYTAMPITNTSAGFGTTLLTGWAWNFGDGTSASGQNPSHTYAAPGTYTVTLTVTGQFGCTSTTTRTVTVYPLPTASFTFANACQNDNLTFTSTSNPGAGNITQTLWDVDNNGTTDYTTSPAGHRFTNAGTHPVTLIVVTNNGCRDTITQNVTVYSLPVASFTTTPACQNDAVSFQSTSSVTNSSISQTMWDVNSDGVNDYTTSSGNHTYTQAGNHTIRLIVQSAQGCRDTISQTVTVYPLPVASFTAVNACQNDAVSLTSTSTVSSGTVTNHFWDVNNDNATDYTTTTVHHPYAQDGNHLVTLIVESNQGCRDTLTQSITVYPLPVASFTSQNACANDAVQFSSTSTVSSGTIAQTFWDVNADGIDEYTTSPASHVYTQDGNHSIRLIVQTAQGCRDTITQSVTVYSLPVASFTATPACQNQAVGFQSTATVTNSTISQTLWDVNSDGVNDYTTSPASHVYTQDGNHSIRLIVQSAQGCRDTISQTVTVYPLPVASFTAVNACQNDAVSLTSTSTVSSGTVTNHFWDVNNDNATDYTTTTVHHPYAQDGNHLVTLIVESNHGCRDTVSQSITVYPLPVASFTSQNACDQDAVSFSSTSTVSSGTITQFSWDVESDGVLDYSNASGSHMYPQDGTYSITLIVASNEGCRDTVRQNVTVYPLPIAAFTVGNACLYEAVSFQSQATVSSGSIVANLWDIDNNNTIDYSGVTGTHTYPSIGNYTIQLIVVTDNGCRDSITQNVIVHPLPQANFAVTNVCDQDPITFLSNSSVISGAIVQTSWDMESDGAVDYTSVNGTHVYPNAGTYSITLIVTTDMGCADTAYQNVTIYPLPVANFGVDKDVLTLDDGVITLTNQSTGETNWEWDLLGTYFFNEPTVFYEFLDTGEFCFDLRVISDRGCEDQTTRCVTVKPGFHFYIPNTFTPNEDKLNNVFIPKGLGVVDFKMEIFTRWGDKIFESESFLVGWNGIDNDGKNYPQGVYVYKIQVIDYKNNVYDYVGNVNLIR